MGQLHWALEAAQGLHVLSLVVGCLVGSPTSSPLCPLCLQGCGWGLSPHEQGRWDEGAAWRRTWGDSLARY